MPGYISEVRYSNGAVDNFVEIVVPRGTDTSAYTLEIYDSNGTMTATFPLGAPDVTYAHNDGYVIDPNDAGWFDIDQHNAFALVDDNGNVLQFLGFQDAVTASEGAADGMTSSQYGHIAGGGESAETNDGGVTYVAQTSPNPGTIPCFTPGTLIATPGGDRPVERLVIGDRVTLLDGGSGEILWLRQRDVAFHDARPDQLPVSIKRGALGPGNPARDLVVSPQHRILISRDMLPGAGRSGVLVPAKALCALPRIDHTPGVQHATYIHLALRRHGVVGSDGLPSESLLIGPTVLWGLSGVERRDLRLKFPAPNGTDYLNGPPARPLWTVGMTRRAIAQTPSRRSEAA